LGGSFAIEILPGTRATVLLQDFRKQKRQAAAKFKSLRLKAAPKLSDAQQLIAQENGFERWSKLNQHVESLAEPTVEVLQQAEKALREDDAAGLRKLLQRHRALKARINDPAGEFGSPPIANVRSAAMLGVLLEAGGDISARSNWWAGGFGLLDSAPPELAAYAIGRGAVIMVHAAARLGMIEKLRELIAGDLALVHAPCPGASPRRSRVHPHAGQRRLFPHDRQRQGGTIYQWELGWYVSACQIAKAFRHAGIFDLLMEQSPAEEKLLNACWLHDERMVNTLLEERPGLAEALPAAGRRQLAHAARNNDTIAARLMIRAGLPEDTFSQHHATPLHWAAWHGNAELVRRILRRNPPLENSGNEHEGTPLDWAMHGSKNGWHRQEDDYAATVKALLDAGANLPAKAGGTDTVIAAFCRHPRWVNRSKRAGR
jgi:hypothetical protein